MKTAVLRFVAYKFSSLDLYQGTLEEYTEDCVTIPVKASKIVHGLGTQTIYIELEDLTKEENH